MSAPAPDLGPDWQRLDPRMLLVHPVRELIRFLPALIALAVAGTASGGAPWQLLGVVVPIALGLLRYFTTRYRISEGRVELSRGLLSRRLSSTPLDRVRTVDLTASIIHRVLGLTTLRIGTGTASSDDNDAFDLDGLPVDRARALRADLLRVGPTQDSSDPSGPSTAVDPSDVVDPAGTPEPIGPVAEFDARWLRFAPFTGTGLIIVAAVAGVTSQFLDSVDLRDWLGSQDLSVPPALAVVMGVMALLVVLLAVSVLGYLVTNGGFRLFRDAGAWHVSRGLLTTRETSIDQDRMAGVAIGEPLALRLVGGRHLQAIVTGVNRSERGSSMLVPASDADVAPRAARTILGHDAPVDAPLVSHGPAAARRRWTRALLPAAVPLVLAIATVAAGAPWWLLLPGLVLVAGAAGLAADRVAGLGHALVEGHVVARSGSLTRKREMLAVDHVIGWQFRSTWFQRRVGLTTMAATMAAGSGAVGLVDVPDQDAVRLADEALPGLVSQFTT